MPHKPLILFTTFLLSATCAYTQITFTLNSRLGAIQVNINGQNYVVDSNAISIPTHYPAFDTLIFLEQTSFADIPILCNFKPDSSYSIHLACCAEPDIIPASKFLADSLDYWVSEEQDSSIRNHFLDRPSISIKTSAPPSTNLYAWLIDFSAAPIYSSIDTTISKFGVPIKGDYYWNNITTILFFKIDTLTETHLGSPIEEMLNIPNIVELYYLTLRLFDNGNYLLIYDEVTNSVSIAYLEDNH